jgi:hypothetical protein
MDVVLESSCTVLATVSISAANSCLAGVPIQGDIRNLATDRWIQMYPS